MKQHVALGDMIVRDVPNLELVRAGVRHHHERWDGHGYLDRLIGEEIPLIARILAVGDAFSAMTTTRPYRKALSVEEALRRLTDAAGSQLDPQLVTAFVTGMEQAADAPLPGTAASALADAAPAAPVQAVHARSPDDRSVDPRPVPSGQGAPAAQVGRDGRQVRDDRGRASPHQGRVVDRAGRHADGHHAGGDGRLDIPAGVTDVPARGGRDTQAAGRQEQQVGGRLRVGHVAAVDDGRPARQVQGLDRRHHLGAAAGGGDGPADRAAGEAQQQLPRAGQGTRVGVAGFVQLARAVIQPLRLVVGETAPLGCGDRPRERTTIGADEGRHLRPIGAQAGFPQRRHPGLDAQRDGIDQRAIQVEQQRPRVGQVAQHHGRSLAVRLAPSLGRAGARLHSRAVSSLGLPAMDRGQLYEALGYVAGTLLAFAVGLLGPALAVAVAANMPDDLVTRGIYGLAAMFIVGTVAGVFGRGLPGLAGLFVGVYLADQLGESVKTPHPDWLPGVAMALIAATIGYAIARAIDPLWGSGGYLAPERPPRLIDGRRRSGPELGAQVRRGGDRPLAGEPAADVGGRRAVDGRSSMEERHGGGVTGRPAGPRRRRPTAAGRSARPPGGRPCRRVGLAHDGHLVERPAGQLQRDEPLGEGRRVAARASSPTGAQRRLGRLAIAGLAGQRRRGAAGPWRPSRCPTAPRCPAGRAGGRAAPRGRRRCRRSRRRARRTARGSASTSCRAATNQRSSKVAS